MDKQDTCLGFIKMPLFVSLMIYGAAIVALSILNLILMFIVPFSYVFFGTQTVVLYAAFIFFLLGVVLNKKNVHSTRKLVRKAMIHCTFLLIPAWGAGVTYFVLNEESHHLAVAEFVLMSLAYTCIPVVLFTGLQLKLQEAAKDQPDSDSEASSDEEVVKNKNLVAKNNLEGLVLNSSEDPQSLPNSKDSLY